MKSSAIDIKPPVIKGFLWKYIDIHRLIYFLTERKMFFCRLDMLEDPYEGVKMSLLQQESFYRSIPPERPAARNDIPDQIREQPFTDRPLQADKKIREVEKSQKSQFVNCWFCGERESIAMWNLYSNPDSVAVKICFEDLVKGMEEPFREFVKENGSRVYIIGDSVHYMRLNPFDMGDTEVRLAYNALKKDVAFEHEKEYRFLIPILEKKGEEDIPFFEIPIRSFYNMKFSIVTHPRMEDWKHENIRRLLSTFDIPFEVQRSAIRLRK
jgi:hypothetical protein